MLCGTISPKTTMPIDARANAMIPEVRSSSKIEIAEFTRTFICAFNVMLKFQAF